MLARRLLERLGLVRGTGKSPAALREPQLHFVPWEFSISPELEQVIRHELKAKPTPSQWQMILSRAQNTYVNAGAGSGKSTTLIQRVLVLHRFLGIPLDEITVFSFTRASTTEFRKRLQTVFKEHGVCISDAMTERMVTTFHAKLLKFQKTRSPLFDFLGSSKGRGVDQDTVPSEMEPLVGLADLEGTSTKQEEFLRGVYKECLERDNLFRGLIEGLYRQQLRRALYRPEPKEEMYKEFLLRRMAQEDQAVAPSLQGIFGRTVKELSLVRFALGPKHPGIEFVANGFCEPLGCYVVFVPSKKVLGTRDNEKINGFPLRNWLVTKARVLAQHSDKEIRFVDSNTALELVLEENRWEGERARGRYRIPVFEYAPAGEQRHQKIWRALYNVGQFIESMGLSVGEVAKEGKSLGDLSERDFLVAAKIFWEHFQKLLSEMHLVRFGSLFASLSEDKRSSFERVPESVLRSMTHILIDEFQDISPEVVKWIRGVLLAHRDRGVPASLMCIGDDYQSIYGWRGSSPHYFMRYESEVRAERTQAIKMEENFRSGQVIIDHGEQVLSSVMNKTEKHGRACNEEVQPGSVHFREGENLKEVRDCVDGYLRQCRGGGTEKDHSIMVLTRTNQKLTDIRKALGQLADSERIRFLTYHRSKGLEARYCVLVGDCAYEKEAPLKNLIYRLAGFPQSFDDAQRDEALRLGYVAITRAAKECTWFAEPLDGGAFNRARGRT